MNINFSTVLASSVHDMKNSVGMLIFSLQKLIEESSPQTAQQKAVFSQLEYEAARINNDLVQLLTLYRLDEKILSASVDEASVSEVLSDQIARNETLLANKGIEITLNCDEDLIGYFDAELIGSVVNNLLVNSARYARTQISMSAKVEAPYLVIDIEDDGAGFPEAMLTSSHEGEAEAGSINTLGATGLGLVFARKILSLHGSEQIKGYMDFSNDGINGGAKVRLYVP